MVIGSFKYWLLALFFCATAFFFSYALMPYYVFGDQEHYRGFYDAAYSYSFKDAFEYYHSALGSREPFYFILVYCASPFVDKDILISFSNAVVMFFIFRLFFLCRVSSFVLLWFLLNFYLLVIFFAAERLKFGLLFCLLALNYAGSLRWFFWCVGVLSHTQTAFLLMAAVLSYVRHDISRLLVGRLTKRFVFVSFFGLVGVAGVFAILGEHISSKISAYTDASLTAYTGGWAGILKPLLFLFMTLFYARGKVFEVILLHLPIVLAASIFGSERLVIFSYFVFLYFALRVKRGLNFGVLAVGAYFNYKGFLFVMNFIEHGDGFYVAG